MALLALGGSDCEALHGGVLGQPVNALSSLAYVVAAGFVLRRGGPPAMAVALALVGVGSVLYHGPMTPGAELVHDASLIAVPVAALGWCGGAARSPSSTGRGGRGPRRGAIANVLSRTGAPLCRPDSLLQGHAVWHVLTAVGAALWLARWPRSPCQTSRRVIGGPGRIRTSEGYAGRFTVCFLWPLGHRPWNGTR